jgi:hypothetical protein
MSILWVRPKLGYGMTTGPEGQRTWNRSYTLRSDVPDEIRSRILASGMIPVYGAPHPEDFSAICTVIHPEQDKDHPYLWHIDCEWSTQSDSGSKKDPKDSQKAPDQRRPKWKRRFEPIHRYLPRDFDGKVYCDSAGSPFDPPPETPIFVQHFTIQRYEPVSSGVDAADRAYMNATNTDTWLSAAPNEALIANIEREDEFLFNQWWFATTYEVLVNPIVQMPGNAGTIGGWNPLKIVDAGPKELDVNGKPQPIKDRDFIDGRPTFLDGAGHRLGRDGQGNLLDTVLLSFRNVNRKSFAALNLVPPY